MHGPKIKSKTLWNQMIIIFNGSIDFELNNIRLRQKSLQCSELKWITQMHVNIFFFAFVNTKISIMMRKMNSNEDGSDWNREFMDLEYFRKCTIVKQTKYHMIWFLELVFCVISSKFLYLCNFLFLIWFLD